MKEYAKKPENASRTLDSNPKASKQASISQILQRYKDRAEGKPVQRQSINEEELLQAKVAQQDHIKAVLQRYSERNIQRYASEEDEELIQGKFDTAQREEIDEDEILQGKFESDTQSEQEPVQREEKPNNTGLPDNLKTDIENLSGYSMDDAKVHYNSDKPAQLQALAYTQGTDIHVALGQEQHLPHEAWHVVQQKQGRVQPTMQLQGVNVNDNEGLEREADVMGRKSLNNSNTLNLKSKVIRGSVLQRLMTSDQFRERSTPFIGRRGVNNGRFYEIIEPLLDLYNQLGEDQKDAQNGVLYSLHCIVLSWINQRPNSRRGQLRDDLLNEIITKRGNLVLEENELNMTRDTGRLFSDINSFHFHENKSLNDILGVFSQQQKITFWTYINRIKKISTPDGIKKIIVAASENVLKTRQFLPFGDDGNNRAVNQYSNNFIQIYFSRLDKMTNYIVMVSQQQIDDEQTFGQRYYIDSTGSDPHVEGKHALFLRNRETLTIEKVYKHRSLQPDNLISGNHDEAPDGVLSNLNHYFTQDSLNDYQIPELGQQLTPGDVSFASMTIDEEHNTESFEHKVEEMVPEQAQKYYYNLGMMEVSARIFGFGDLHRDNIMPVVRDGVFKPLIIDAEIAFTRFQTSGIEKDIDYNQEGDFSSYFNIDRVLSVKAFCDNAVYRKAYLLGFSYMKHIITEKKVEIIRQLNNQFNNLTRTRITPYNTATLSHGLYSYTAEPNIEQKKKFMIAHFNTFPIIMNEYDYFHRDNRIPAEQNGKYVHSDDKVENELTRLKQKMKFAFDRGLIPAFEIEFAANNICNVLCDAPVNGNQDSIVGQIVSQLPPRELMINRMTLNIQNVEKLQSQIRE